MSKGCELCIISLIGMESIRIHLDVGLGIIFGLFMLCFIILYFLETCCKGIDE